jgi:hypothetical protein
MTRETLACTSAHRMYQDLPDSSEASAPFVCERPAFVAPPFARQSLPYEASVERAIREVHLEFVGIRCSNDSIRVALPYAARHSY